MESNTTDLTEEQKAAAELEAWVDKINEEADAKSKELATLFGTEVVPSVFVIDPLKDAAIAFVRKPDAVQTIKLIRTLGESMEHGLVFVAQAQLIRDADLLAKGVQGTASDARFIDKDGQYDIKWSEINAGLLLSVQKVVGLAKNAFKKK